jgi:uncharacterized protein YecE (DUF72 family)
LAESGHLGAVIVRFPTWFSPRPAAWEELAELPARLAGFRVAVELGNPRWFDRDACEDTLGMLERLGLCFVCRDRAGANRPVVAATGDMAFVRFPGRAVHGWAGLANGPNLTGTAARPDDGRCDEADNEASPPKGSSRVPEEPMPWAYRYSQAELAAWVPAVRDLASCTSEVHLIMDNCWRADAVDNAASLLQLLGAA